MLPTNKAYMSRRPDPEAPVHAYDSDSFILHVDNCASTSLTNDSSDFIDTPTKHKGQLTGVSGSIPIKSSGTVKWSIADDTGRIHSLIIPNTLYVPGIPDRILSPQHWA